VYRRQWSGFWFLFEGAEAEGDGSTHIVNLSCLPLWQFLERAWAPGEPRQAGMETLGLDGFPLYGRVEMGGDGYTI
jgi:hypothetical protein